MVRKIANKWGKYLAEVSANSNKFEDKYSYEEIESILIYKITGILKKIEWIVLLALLSSVIFLFIKDTRFINTTGIFFITILALRNFFGGFHANSEVVCLAISTLVPVVMGYLSLKVNINFYLILVIYLFAYFSAIKKGVVDHPNKRFSNNNKLLTLQVKSVLFKIGFSMLIIINIINISMYYMNYSLVSNAIALGVCTSTINLYFGK